MLYSAFAWLVALACVGVMLRFSARLTRVPRSSLAELLDRLRAECAGATPETNGRTALAVLDDIVADVEEATRVVPELPQGLARVALAAATGLAVLAVLAGSNLQSRLIDGLLSFLAGLVGALGTAWIGRAAKAQSREHRKHWSQVVRRARQEIQKW